VSVRTLYGILSVQACNIKGLSYNTACT
jgi:hypothetical protein